MIRYNTKEDKLEMSYEDICMTLHDCSDTLDCSTGYGGTYEAIVEYIDKLQNNWNKLKKWLEEQKKFIEDVPTFTLEITHNHFGMVGAYKNTLSQMQELEQGKDE